jgi:hypothetical protein
MFAVRDVPTVSVHDHVHPIETASFVDTVEAADWVWVGEVPGLVGLWVMRRGTTESA